MHAAKVARNLRERMGRFSGYLPKRLNYLTPNEVFQINGKMHRVVLGA